MKRIYIMVFDFEEDFIRYERESFGWTYEGKNVYQMDKRHICMIFSRCQKYEEDKILQNFEEKYMMLKLRACRHQLKIEVSGVEKNIAFQIRTEMLRVLEHGKVRVEDISKNS